MSPHTAAYIDLQNRHGRPRDVTEVATVGFRTYVTGGFALGHCPTSAQLCFICVCYSATGQGVRSQRSKIGPKISEISRYIGQISWRFEIDRPKALKEA